MDMPPDTASSPGLRHRLERQAAARGLLPLGDCPVLPEDGLNGAGSILLLGPGPDFWNRLCASPEFHDGGCDPVDRWSQREIVTLAAEFDARALFPFGGPPWWPFTGWARRSGRCWTSPVGLLVHDTQGLMVSFRGALALPERLAPEPGGPQPCLTCVARPCLDACPVNALAPEGYDLDRCHDHLGRSAGTACMTGGCLVRRACPLSAGARRNTEQSAYHMRQFHKDQGPGAE